MSSPSVLATDDAAECVDEPHNKAGMPTALRHVDGSLNKITVKDRKKAVNLIEAAMNRSTQAVLPDAGIATAQARAVRSSWQAEQSAALRARLLQLEIAQTGQAPNPVNRSAPMPGGRSILAANDPENRLFCAVEGGTKKPSAAPRHRLISLWFAAPATILGAVGLSWVMFGFDNSPSAKNAPRFEPASPVAFQPEAAPHQVAPIGAAASMPSVAFDELATVRAMLDHWRLAWMARDVTAYLGFYSPNFVPSQGQSQPQWQAARRKALARPAGIDVQIAGLRLQSLGKDQVKVEFLQDYSSGSYREVGQPKSLILERSGTRWLITREWGKMQALLQPSLPLTERK